MYSSHAPARGRDDREAAELAEKTGGVMRLCLFDLDDTLVHTSDLDPLRSAFVGRTDAAYTAQLQAAYALRPNRQIYSLPQLQALRIQFPQMKLGVFTRAPRHYARTILDLAFPGFSWDTIVGYEDVVHTKPAGDGIWKAMHDMAEDHLDQVVLVGDNKNDVMAAYHGGCWSVLDRTSWSASRTRENWWSLERIPDAIIDSPAELPGALAAPHQMLPELERQIATGAALGRGKSPRLDKINHFPPRGWDVRSAWISVLGRLFSGYDGLKYRAGWHQLTSEIITLKDAHVFPQHWIDAVRTLVRWRVPGVAQEIVLTVIPHKPGRTPRLERFLEQVAQSYQDAPDLVGRVICIPDILAYRAGALSHSGAHLNREQRFENVRDNLFVNRPEDVRGKRVVVLDDVSTTGATLIYASHYLREAGAREIDCASVAKAIGDI